MLGGRGPQKNPHTFMYVTDGAEQESTPPQMLVLSRNALLASLT